MSNLNEYLEKIFVTEEKEESTNLGADSGPSEEPDKPKKSKNTFKKMDALKAEVVKMLDDCDYKGLEKVKKCCEKCIDKDDEDEKAEDKKEEKAEEKKEDKKEVKESLDLAKKELLTLKEELKKKKETAEKEKVDKPLTESEEKVAKEAKDLKRIQHLAGV
jgi:hypothetical protein